jgi:DNA-binding transcriptional MerR regulator
VDTLQQILFYRELGVGLDSIRRAMASPVFDRIGELRDHLGRLIERKEQIDRLIANVEKTIAAAEGGTSMSDKEKFEGFKQKIIDENEAEYGKEIREKYGDDKVDKANDKIRRMTKDRYAKTEELSKELDEAIRTAFRIGDPAGKEAQKACKLHKEWLMNYWDSYSKEAHMQLVQGYVDDERFTAYYDRIAPGCAVFLRDAMRIYTGVKG